MSSAQLEHKGGAARGHKEEGAAVGGNASLSITVRRASHSESKTAGTAPAAPHAAVPAGGIAPPAILKSPSQNNYYQESPGVYVERPRSMRGKRSPDEIVQDLERKVKEFYTVHRAAYLNKPKELEAVLEDKKDPNEVDAASGNTPLTFACRYGNDECVRILCAQPAIDVNKTENGKVAPLHHACATDSLHNVTTLLDAKANIEQADEAGNTPLLYAARAGDLRIVELLLKRGANIRAVNSQKQNAAMIAVIHCQRVLVELLTKDRLKLNVDQQDTDGNTALHYACQLGYAAIAKHLLKIGCSTRMPNLSGLTPAQVTTDKALADLVAASE